ncbi:MAG: long-chain-fatty-acid--CoA ligase [Pseudomonadota bacterium]
MLLHHFLEYYARNFPDLPCVTVADQTTTYSEAEVLANKLARGLQQLGVSKGERIAILGENSIEHMLLFEAASKTGAVAVSLNYRLAPAELAFILKDSSAKVLLALDDSLSETLDGLRPLLPPSTQLVTREGANSMSWHELLDGQSGDPVRADVAPEDPVLQLYTSGTTGNPKGVVSTHANLVMECVMNTTLTTHRVNPGMAGLLCAPMFHIGGAGSILVAIYGGSHTILHRAFDPAAVVDAIEAYPINNIFMVPAMIMAVLGLPGIEQRDFSRLQVIYYGASPISEAVLRQAIDVFDTDFVQMYGMTETTGTVVNLSPEDHRRALAGKPELLKSCGRPSVGAEVSIRNPEGDELPAGEVGEIWVKSETNMVAYYNLPEATAENLTGGWVHTGDAGYLDTEGYLYLKDRIKDMVVSGGENIYPVEVENAIAHHDAVADVAVIGVPDEKFGEALLAFVVLKPGASLALDEMIGFCRDRIAGYKIPRQLEIIDAMPRNPSGKLLKKELRKPYWESSDRAIS